MLAMLMIEYKLPTSAVPDFADWKQVFDTDPVGRKAHGATRHWIYQDPDDPNHFLLSIEFRSVEEANGFLTGLRLEHSLTSMTDLARLVAAIMGESPADRTSPAKEKVQDTLEA